MNLQNKHYVVSVDIGATSGRIMLVNFDNYKVKYDEVHRFKNRLIKAKDHLYWDMKYLIDNIIEGLSKINTPYYSIGISTWGCDFCLLDEDGKLIRNPICYRDECYQSFNSKFDYKDIYEVSGIQKLPFNSIFQFEYLRTLEKEVYDKTSKILMIPDYIAYYLSGEMFIEETNASTSACYDALQGSFSKSLLAKIDFDLSKFPKIIKPTTPYGMLKPSLCNKLKVNDVKIIATCTHDTASAILGSSTTYNHAYISSGTWSLMGTLEKQLIKSVDSFGFNYTNEIGFNGSVRYLKNIMGMWLVEEYRRELEELGEDVSFDKIIKELKEFNDEISFIDPDCEIFLSPGSMSERIDKYLQLTKQPQINNRQGYFACIYYSLVCKYRYVFANLLTLTNKEIKALNIFGGGSKNTYMSQLVCNALNVKVINGPIEATVLGNAFVQFMESNLMTEEDISRVISNSEDIKVFEPLENEVNKFNIRYRNFVKILEEYNGRC